MTLYSAETKKSRTRMFRSLGGGPPSPVVPARTVSVSLAPSLSRSFSLTLSCTPPLSHTHADRRRNKGSREYRHDTHDRARGAVTTEIVLVSQHARSLSLAPSLSLTHSLSCALPVSHTHADRRRNKGSREYRHDTVKCGDEEEKDQDVQEGDHHGRDGVHHGAPGGESSD